MIVVLSLLATLPASVWAAEDRRPLLMEGKRTLYQRVVSRPAAQLCATPDATGRAREGSEAPFSVFYVYDRKMVGDGQWLEVSRRPSGATEGWMQAGQVIEWPHTMSAAFTNPAGRSRTLLFRDRHKLMELTEAERGAELIRQLRGDAVANRLPADSPVISIEPAEHVDIAQQFYLLPILSAERIVFAGGTKSRLLNITSVPLATSPLRRQITREEALKDFSVGIVFVVDTTKSMGPYIDRTRGAITRILDKIAGTDFANRVSFGMVAFRNSTELRPGLEYVTKTFLMPEPNQNPQAVRATLASVQATNVSTDQFDEDSIAGIDAALKLPAWRNVDGARYLVLITDAGPRPASDRYSTTHLSARNANENARNGHFAIYTLHLLTDEGRADHSYAAGNYKVLSRAEGETNLYFGVPSGDVAAFDRTVNELADSLVSQINDTINGRTTRVDQPDDSLASRSRIVGYAMQLDYLGRRLNAVAPDVFDAWVVDRDIENPRLPTVDPRIMLSRNQLSDLAEILKLILEKGRANRLSPEDFFAQLRSAAAYLSRDPNRLIDVNFRQLGDLLGEYLQGLPYESQLIGIGEQAWLSMGSGRQREVLENIEDKLRHYDELDRSPGWVAVYPGAEEGEKVKLVRLDMLP